MSRMNILQNLSWIPQKKVIQVWKYMKISKQWSPSFFEWTVPLKSDSIINTKHIAQWENGNSWWICLMNANGQITLYIQNLHAIKTWFFCFDTCNINAKAFIWLPCVNPFFQFWHHYRSSPFMIELLIRACLCLRPQLEFSLCLSFRLR